MTVNTLTTQSLTLSSTGTAPVTVTSAVVSGTGFSLVDGSFPATLNPGQSLTLQVQFNPATTGSSSGQVTINSDSSSGATTVALSGSGTVALSPQLTASGNSLSFGGVTVDTSTTQSLTLRSTGTAPVTINSATISGAGFALTGGALPATLNPGQSIVLQVSFSPSTTGIAAGQVVVSSSSAGNNAMTIALSGRGTAALSPQLTLSSTTLSFGGVTVNTSATQSLTLSSTGTAAVTVNSAAITGAGFSLVGGTLPATLNPGQSMMLQVRFSPTATSASTGQITINSNSSSGATTVALSGSGTAAPSPQLAVSAGALNFGGVTVNTSATQSLTLNSTGTAPVTVDSATVIGTGFSVVGGTFPATLNPGQSVVLQVRFSPTATSAATGQITINSDSSSGAATVTLSGRGTAASSPQLTLSAETLSFGGVTVGSSTTQSLTLSSTGTAAVTVNSAAITGTGFSLVGGILPATLNPGQSMVLQVRFNPATTGAATGQVTINSDSSSGATTVTLSGSGTAASSPQLAVGSSSLSFGGVTVNTSATQSLTLSSTGTAAVTVNSAAITGTGFSLVGGTLPATLNPGQSMVLQVRFSPTATGAVTGRMTINSDSSSGATTVALSGNGTAALNPQLTVSTASLSFGSVTVNTSTTQSLTLRSTGTTSVTVNSAAITGASFSVVAQSFPVTLNPGQSVTLQVEFSPTTAGSSTGQLTINSNSTSGGTASVALSGTGTAANPQLTVNVNSLSFGSVTLNTPTTKTVTLSSAGGTPVTVNSANVTGTGFTLVGGSFPVTLNPGQTVTLQLQFLPKVTGAQSGQVTIASNSTGGNLVIALSGTGAGGVSEVDLSWDAPASSPVSVAGYNIYRSIGTSGSFSAINSSPVSAIVYIDKNIVSGTTYAYIVKSVDASGTESSPSNQITVAIP